MKWKKILLVVVSVLVGIFFILPLIGGWYTEMGGLTPGKADTSGRRENKRIY